MTHVSELNINGSDSNYWRSDNPLIWAWYRFGDEEANSLVKKVPNLDSKRGYASGLLVDTGMRHAHLLYRGDPDQFLRPTSGIAPWSISGMILGENPASTWVEGGVDESIFISPEEFNEAPAGGNRGNGPIGFGSVSYPSGCTIMGWVRIPDTSTNPTVERQIFGNWEINAGGGAGRQFKISWFPQTVGGRNRVVVATARFNDATEATVTSENDTFPTQSGESFFIAVQLHREFGIPWKNSNQGSGLLKLFIGTTVSGLRLVHTDEFTGTDLRLLRGSDSSNFYTFAQDSQASRSALNFNQHLPPNSTLDEWVMVYDGFMPLRRMEYYMNSGINHIKHDDPVHNDFIPINAGQTDLVAYWTFDNQNGINSAPVTSGLGIDMIFGSSSSVSPIAGIRGGSGIQVNTAIGEGTALSSADINAFPHIRASSGLNRMFPDINQSDQWTWLGWIRDRADASNVRYGASLGWWDGTATNHVAMSIGDWVNLFSADGPSDTAGPRHIEHNPSGTADGFFTGPTAGSKELGGALLGTYPNSWHLWALVWDFRNGIYYMVRDCVKLNVAELRLSSISGISKSSFDGDTSAAFIMAAVNATAAYRPWFDDWAIYKRKLTIPEMSGYALSGIAVTPITSPYGTSDPRTLGYWELQNSGTYTDPSGITRTRYNDSSFYIHNLSFISGIFSQGNPLNTRTGTKSTKVETSGSMLNLLRVEHGANLDFSQAYIFAQSGFSTGAWLFIPSGHFGDVNANTSGLYGDHHIVGAWNQALSSSSWRLGIRDNTPFLALRTPTSTFETTTSSTIPFNKAFFLGAMATPSGGGVRVQLFLSESEENFDLRQLADVTHSSFSHLNEVGTSGFSILNTPNTQHGFPSGTRIQNVFLYTGPVKAEGFDSIKRFGFNLNPRESGSISTSDPNNVSHWRLDTQAKQFPDEGKEQNYLFITNDDDHNPGLQRAIHTSGVLFRAPEYLDTLTSNSGVRGLDLGSGSTSYTVLGWIKPNPSPAGSDDEVIFGKHPTRGQGYQVWIPNGGSVFILDSAGIQTSGNNSSMLEREKFNHVAFVHDKVNNRQTVFVNARYAGSSFTTLVAVPPNQSGFALGGRGSPDPDPVAGGGAFSGILDDWMIFSRPLTLPEISGLAANSYNYAESSGEISYGPVGAYISGLAINIISGLIAAWIHGQSEDVELVGAYISGVEGVVGEFGGWMHGTAFISGLFGGFVHGADIGSGVFGSFLHGMDRVSGIVGSYIYGGCQTNGEFDITFTFQIVSSDDFDARLGVELTKFKEFDAKLGLFRITTPPRCSLELPLAGTVVSGLPFVLTARGSGIALDNKSIEQVRFTFADFKGASSGTLISGIKDSGLYEVSRVIDTRGYYTVKIEVIDSFGYRTSCAQQFIAVPSGSTSGAVLSQLPGISLTVSPISGVTKQIVAFTHSLSGLSTISGILEYTDFADGQESLVTSLEMPSGTIDGKVWPAGVRQHEYSMPGFFTPVWAASGSWGIVSDTVAIGFDFQNF